MPHRIVISKCDCVGVPPGLTNVPVAMSNTTARRVYVFQFNCTNSPVNGPAIYQLKYRNGTGKWSVTFLSTIYGEEDPTEFKLEMTANGTSPRSVVIRLTRTDTNELIGLWDNLAHWIPHLEVQMRCVWFNRPYMATWGMPDRYPCLTPYRPTNALCSPSNPSSEVAYVRVRVPAYIARFTLIDLNDSSVVEQADITLSPEMDIMALPWSDYTDYVPPTTVDNPYPTEDVQPVPLWPSAGDFDFRCGFRGFGLTVPSGSKTFTAPGGITHSISTAPFQVIVDIGMSGAGFLVWEHPTGSGSTVDPPDELEDLDGPGPNPPEMVQRYQINVNVYQDEATLATTGEMGNYGPTIADLLAGVYDDGIPSGVHTYVPTVAQPGSEAGPHIQVEYHKVADQPDPTIPCLPLTPQPGVNCGGSGKWKLQRKCYSPVFGWLYYLTLVSSTCSGACDTNSCVPEVPLELDSDVYISDELAETMGLLDILTEQEEGDGHFYSPCKCIGGPSFDPEPACPGDCTGTCSYQIIGYSSENGAFGETTANLIIICTNTGESGGIETGRVYLEQMASDCTIPEEGDPGCSCPDQPIYTTATAFWGGSGFPSNSSALGDPAGPYDCITPGP